MDPKNLPQRYNLQQVFGRLGNDIILVCLHRRVHQSYSIENMGEESGISSCFRVTFASEDVVHFFDLIELQFVSTIVDLASIFDLFVSSWESKVPPPKLPPPRSKAQIRPY